MRARLVWVPGYHSFPGKVNKPPLSIKPPPPLPLPSILILQEQLTWTDLLWFIQAGNSCWFWSSAARPPTSCAELSQLYALVLWRIVTIFLLLEKAVHRPVTTSPSSRNLDPVDAFR